MKPHSVTRKYKGKEMTIHNVPVYYCKDDHIRFTIGTRRKILLLLNEANEKGETEVYFN